MPSPRTFTMESPSLCIDGPDTQDRLEHHAALYQVDRSGRIPVRIYRDGCLRTRFRIHPFETYVKGYQKSIKKDIYFRLTPPGLVFREFFCGYLVQNAFETQISMEDFIAYSFIGLSAVLCILGLSSGRRVWTLKERGLRFARDILPLALVSMDAWGGIPAFLLTADIMFCDAVLLQSVTVPQPRSRIPFMAILLSLACLARSALEASGHRFPVEAATFTTLSSAFLLAAGPFGEWLPWSARRREAVQGTGRLSQPTKA